LDSFAQGKDASHSHGGLKRVYDFLSCPTKMLKNQKIRYAVVGLGWIAQESVLPGFKNATKNSELVALVTDDPEKARKLSKEYDVAQTASYDGYEKLLRSGVIDAAYIALPNSLHADFTVRAARAGVHVLCEKPMARSVEECESMTHACEKYGVKLMLAYRLHFEPGNLKAIEIITGGERGEPRFFSSVFGQQVPEGKYPPGKISRRWSTDGRWGLLYQRGTLFVSVRAGRGGCFRRHDQGRPAL
jgi:predicted dehydrogenase